MSGVWIDNFVYQIKLSGLDARKAKIKVTGGRIVIDKSDARATELALETHEVEITSSNLENARLSMSQAPRRLTITASDLRGADLTNAPDFSAIATFTFKDTKINSVTEFRDDANRVTALAAGAVDCSTTGCAAGN